MNEKKTPEVKTINENTHSVSFDDGTDVNLDTFKYTFLEFLQKRIAGETLVPSDMERFMARTSAKNLKLLMKGKKMEGYLEGSMDKFLSKGSKITLLTIMVIVIVITVVVVILRSQGII
jgi:hypothetical protein